MNVELEGDPKQVSNSISVSKILGRNRAVIRSEMEEEARKTWEIGGKLGLESGQDYTNIVARLVEMENRDRAQCKRGRQQKKCQEVKETSLCG